MTNTRTHASILTVIAAAGVDTDSLLRQGNRNSQSSVEDEELWMEKRRLSWVRMREKRRSRRAGEGRWGEMGFNVLNANSGRYAIAEEDDAEESLADGVR